jgi:hypothetical protein
VATLTLVGTLKDAHIAAARELGDLYPPATRLEFDFLDGDGSGSGFRTWAWTDGGAELGDRIDRLAERRRLTALRLVHAAHPHLSHHEHGRVHVAAITLAPVLATLRAGDRVPVEFARAVCNAPTVDAGEVARRGWPWGMGPEYVQAYADRVNALDGP